MSLEIYNELVKKLGLTLPGRDEEKTDCSRGYVGWGPGEDMTCGPGKTVEHDDWPAALAAIQNPAREIHDFYFNVNTPSKKCECCAGSGRNKEYAELAEGFYRFKGGRYAGWGEGPLRQNEIDALLEEGRLGRAKKGEVTPENLKQHLGRMGHDLINQWILTPIRAANLGIDCNDCYDCVGTGLIATAPTRISLYMWTVDPMRGSTRVDTAEDVKIEEIDEIREFLAEIGWEATKRRFGWPSGDNMHSEIRTQESLRRDASRNFGDGGRWESSMKFRSMREFRSEFGGYDPDLNLIFDYRVVARPVSSPEVSYDAGYETEEFDRMDDDVEILDEADETVDLDFSGSELPEKFSLQLLMTHPRKGADRILLINGCTPEDGEYIKALLRKSYEVHGRHFAWAAGREFGNEDRREEVAAPTEPAAYDPMKFFTGRK